jgi:hypothetical protein
MAKDVNIFSDKAIIGTGQQAAWRILKNTSGKSNILKN